MSRVPDNDRLMDLLAAQATEGLSSPEARELEALMGAPGAPDRDSLDRAASALHIALAGQGARDPLPSSLRRRLLEAVDRETRAPEIIARIGSAPAARRRTTRFLAGSGWLVAAACLVVAVAGWWPRLIAPASVSPSAALAQFVKTTPDAVRAPWGDFNALDTGAPPEVRGVQGEVIWSDSKQHGFMRLAGLPANDPAREQYQLWIVDAERGLAQRISGAVFDAAAGETVVPITPEYRVGKAAVFAVTIERPGGVVVSDMSRRACMAAVGG